MGGGGGKISIKKAPKIKRGKFKNSLILKKIRKKKIKSSPIFVIPAPAFAGVNSGAGRTPDGY